MKMTSNKSQLQLLQKTVKNDRNNLNKLKADFEHKILEMQSKREYDEHKHVEEKEIDDIDTGLHDELDQQKSKDLLEYKFELCSKKLHELNHTIQGHRIDDLRYDYYQRALIAKSTPILECIWVKLLKDSK